VGGIFSTLGEMINAYRILVGKSKGKRTFRRRREVALYPVLKAPRRENM
jgi:hypothetical protein